MSESSLNGISYVPKWTQGVYGDVGESLEEVKNSKEFSSILDFYQESDKNVAMKKLYDARQSDMPFDNKKYGDAISFESNNSLIEYSEQAMEKVTDSISEGFHAGVSFFNYNKKDNKENGISELNTSDMLANATFTISYSKTF